MPIPNDDVSKLVRAAMQAVRLWPKCSNGAEVKARGELFAALVPFRNEAINPPERLYQRQQAADVFGKRRLITTAEAAELMSLSARTLQCWRLRGGGPRYIRLAPVGARTVRAVRYRLADLERWIAEREVSSTTSDLTITEDTGGEDARRGV